MQELTVHASAYTFTHKMAGNITI